MPASWLSPEKLPEPVLHKRQRIGPSRAKALHPGTTAEALRRLVEDSDDNVAAGIILHPNTPPDALRALLKKHYQHYSYYDIIVRGFPIAAAIHPNADATLLRELAAHEEPVVRRLARRHPNAPGDLTEISRHSVVGKQGERALKAMSWREDATALWMILHAIHAPTRITWIAARAASANPMKRLAAVLCLHQHATQRAASPYLTQRRWSRPEERLWGALKNDANRVVRAAANAPVTPVFDFTL